MHRDRPQDLATADFYESQATRYTQETSQLSVARHIARFTSSLPQGALVLDVGCGAGRDVLEFRKRGFEPVGLDRSFALASWARRHTGTSMVMGGMRSLPFRSHVFEGLWASACILHLGRDELAGTIKECRRVISKRAPFFTSMKLGFGEDRDRRGRRFTYVSAEEWRDLLRSNQFDVLSMDIDHEVDQRSAHTQGPSGWLSAYSQAA